MKKILIIKANYYKLISNKLAQQSINLLKNKAKVSLIEVPGIFEIPVTISKNYNKFDGFVALGCVIRGQTPHFNLICKATFNSIMSLSTTYKKPIGNGIITALNARQAHERCGIKRSKKQNKGFEAANAVLSILNNGPKKV
jgi:6,7-dimethyl-8-ribityllumazine synthase|tara:strand:- start:681 stop:1103 length:423 start_codon:yes stop_codon:yes gene_type:complete